MESHFFTDEYIDYLSHSKGEPLWMNQKRKEALRILKEKKLPTWGPILSGLDLGKIVYYKEPATGEESEWEKVPDDIMKVYEDLGIRKAEREYLGGVGAQYDFGVVYHKVKESLRAQGVIFENFDVAAKEYESLVRPYFMNECIAPDLHYFSALHGVFTSGGTFIYVPPHVNVELPLQAYFRMNQEAGGQFEHTLIILDEGASLTYIEGCSAPRYEKSSLHAGGVEIFVGKNASMKYVSIENWSKNTYNLNTKKAIVSDGGKMEWISGNFGAHKTMLYPATVLKGNGSKNESVGIALAGESQEQDTGFKVIHLGENTSSKVLSKSIAQNGGITTYRGLVYVSPKAKNTVSFVECDSVVLDDLSYAAALPQIQDESYLAEILHEARTGRLEKELLEYVMLKGFSEKEALRMILGGFSQPLMKALPIEYALEFNKLLDIEIGM
jgi:Fe-S cluster assembly protein SufB